MTRGTWITRSSFALVSLAAAAVWAQSAEAPGQTRPDRSQLSQPVYKVAQKLADASSETQTPAAPAEHPLTPALKIASGALANMQANVKDYSCTMVKRERLGGKLGDNEYLYIKVRHEPFSVYTFYLKPDNLKGQEAIYVAGRNGGDLLAHGVGVKKIFGMVSLKPTSAVAMSGQRYPITEIGILNLTRRLVEVAESDMKYGECDVKFFNGARIKASPTDPGRLCTCIQVTHPVPRKNFLFHVARVYVDDQLNIPVRYEAYEWPAAPGGQPSLVEQYTYLNVKINNGFTDSDFDDNNPAYAFHK